MHLTITYTCETILSNTNMPTIEKSKQFLDLYLKCSNNLFINYCTYKDFQKFVCGIVKKHQTNKYHGKPYRLYVWMKLFCGYNIFVIK